MVSYTKEGEHSSGMDQDIKTNYLRFAAMIAKSIVVMFGLMYLNTYELSHVRWSETRLYMTLIMGAAMAVIMLSFMHEMYGNNRINIAIYLGSLVVFLIALFLLRSQTLVQDSSYMRAMVPHHSIAILTSERADEIIRAQRREIEEMNWLLEDIRANGIASTQAEAAARPVPDFEAES